MLEARSKEARVRWLVLGLSAHALAAALLLANVLSSSSERAAAVPRGPQAPAPGAEALPAPAPAAIPTVAHRERVRPDSGTERVRNATEILARALDAPEYDGDVWLREVRKTAQELGPEALPELAAVLADDSRPVAEHLVASELAAALSPR